MEKNPLLNVTALAKELNVPKSWVYQQTAQGQKGIPHMRMGKYIRFDLEEVLNFFKNKGNLK